MASSLISFITFHSLVMILLLLHIFSLPRNVEAKHTHSSTTHHHHPPLLRHSSPSPPPSPNPKLRDAYIALQAWKKVIYSDPNNFTTDWVGPAVCNYTGIYCAPPPYDPDILVVAGIDLNHGDIAGFLPDELGLLSDIALIHLNSNRFCGIIPLTFSNLTLLYELDLSNNRFVGPFPNVVLSLPSLKFLDLRFNEFEGGLPTELFNTQLDAVFVNNNRLTNVIPSNIGKNFSASVLVVAHNNFGGCLPPSIANLANTIEELLLINSSLSGCLPQEVGFLYKLKVFDVSYNNIIGPIPYSLAGLAHLEQLNLGDNMMSGIVPEGICVLPNVANFTLSYNYFCEEEGICNNFTRKGIAFDDRQNCLPEKPMQRSEKECAAVLEHPVECDEEHCSAGVSSGGRSGIGLVPSGMPAAAPMFWSPYIAPSPTFT